MKRAHSSSYHQTGVFLALLLSLAGARAHADGLIVIHDPGLAPPGHPAFAPLAVKYHHVAVRISDQLATTDIDQVFVNPSNRRLEGTYLFPIPKNAQIDKLMMDVNGTMTEAELLDATKARAIYEDIVRKMRDPALLEYAGQGLFRLRVFPIEPRSEKRIKLSYSQVLRSEGGLVEYVYPLNTERFSSQLIESVSVSVTLDTKQPLKALYSPSHEVEIARHGATHAVVGFEARGVKPDTDFQLFFATTPASELGLSLLTFRENGGDGYFLLLASPPAETRRVIPKDVVFVLDTSGSMAEGGKLEQAKRALRFCLANLNADDRFELVRFSTETEPLFERLVDATEANRKRAEEFVAGLKPIGGTAVDDALATAMQPAETQAQSGRPYVIVFLTDGRPTIGATDEKEILAKVERKTQGKTLRVFSFGIGTDVNTHLLDGLAEATRAASQYVLPKEDIEVKVSSFYSKISHPVLASPKLTLGEGPVRLTKVYPHPLPDLFRGEQLIVCGRYSGAGAAEVTISGSVAGTARTFSEKASFPDKAADHAFVPRLWATRRVGFLLDEIRLRGESAELRDEVVDLARTYGIVTPYTAYLIVEDEARRGVPVTSRSLPTVEHERVAMAEARREYGAVAGGVAGGVVGAPADHSTVHKDGEDAVAGAVAYDRLKRAENAAAPRAANFAAQSALSGRAAEAGARLQDALAAQGQRFVGGRNFYQNGAQWIDAQVSRQARARRVQVKFNSVEYFDLLRRHPSAPQWLSLGRNVAFVLGDVVYEVTE
jgi:Ca-activated chloride channel family protein